MMNDSVLPPINISFKQIVIFATMKINDFQRKEKTDK